MCGIAGYVGGNRAEAEIAVSRMTAALARRGPDSEGIESWDHAVLGHRRLSIFDLSDAGRQPMMVPDRSLAVVFNGAIYNFRALRSDLEKNGYSFRSQTDTEILLWGYRHWGIDGLVLRLRGMFAFGLWDDQSKKLFLVRDRLGVKPLIYTERNGAIGFASTTRALRRAGLLSEIDPEAVAEFLEFGYVTDDRTIYRTGAKVAAGTIVEWCGGRIRQRSYWHFPEAAPAGSISFEEAVEETERLFLEAVRLRLDADVPVGTLLSGGVDSSLVCWAVAKLGSAITAFTVGVPGDPLDESGDAAATAKKLGIPHRVIHLKPEEMAGIQDLTTAYGEPFACASALGMLQVSEAVRASATVLLTGDGGDDIFLGYTDHKNFWLAQQCAKALPSPAPALWRSVHRCWPYRGPARRLGHFFDYIAGGIGAVACAPPGFPAYDRLLGEKLRAVSPSQREIPWSAASGRALLTDFLTFERRTRFTGEFMTKVDSVDMHHALEARSPFLDQEIWNFAGTFPFGVRLHQGKLKAVLRELARRHVSEQVAGGRKRGFGIPVERWLVGRWRPAVEEAFRDSILDREGWIRSDAVLAALSRAVAGGQAPTRLWYLYVLESWMRAEQA
jgi:asparagine synthase (glutamine-hydrolysing)